MEAPVMPEDGRDPVFRHFEEVHDRGLGNMRQEIMSKLYASFVEVQCQREVEMLQLRADLEQQQEAWLQQIQAALKQHQEARLQQLQANSHELVDATIRELRGEMADDQEELLDMMDRSEAQVRADIEEGQDERIKLIHGLEDQLNAMDRRLDLRGTPGSCRPPRTNR
ncbi:hypothetical protein QAD02_007589 [Eretmocerus hayati]|uniref:Uncharacterized protein n=1 Tax=Eretmocerus hayati TaxID=131215 RepID=A0ACC2N443_9HYME|nr:hypothetical protein QAD02_007589 [Eretmocerus hayati]